MQRLANLTANPVRVPNALGRLSVLFRDEEGAFSIEVPDGWRQKRVRGFFARSGGRVAFVSRRPDEPGPWGTLNIAVGGDAFWSVAKRETAAIRFMWFAALIQFKWRRTRVSAKRRQLGGEPNTSWVELTTMDPNGALRELEGHVESVRNEIPYTIQYTYTPGTAEQVERMLHSFRFL